MSKHKSKIKTTKELAPWSQALNTARYYHENGDFANAEAIYQQILTKFPQQAETLHLLGVVYAQTHRLELAEHFIRKAIAYEADKPLYYTHLGNVLKESGQLEDAVECHKKAIKLNPREASAYINLGVCLNELEEYAQAISNYEKALKIDSKNAILHNNIATALCEHEDYQRSIKHYRRAIELKPDFAGAYSSLGNALRRDEQLEEALSSCEKALELDSNYTNAYINKAEILIALENYDQAKLVLQQCFDLPRLKIEEKADVLSSLGNVAMANKQQDEAIEYYTQALQHKHNHKKSLYRLAFIYRTKDDFAKAIAYCNTLVELYPRDIELHKFRAFLLLQVADFTEGWMEYGHRPRASKYFNKYRMDPFKVVILSRLDKVQGKHFFIYREQGLGDEIFFLRFAPRLKALGAKITYAAGAKIKPILERNPYLDKVISAEEPPPKHNFYLMAGDLPLAFEMKTDEEPPQPLPLSAPLAEKMAEIKTRLAKLNDKPLLGLTWRAGTRKEDHLEKDLPKNLLFKLVDLEQLAQHLKDLDVHFISLQRAPKDEEVTQLEALLGQSLHDFSDLNDDLEGMLALLTCLDDYVGVSNTNMHLIAGLNKGARVLVPRPYEWRWPGSDDSSLWFPNFKVYRQGDDDDWVTCLMQLRQDLLHKFGSN